MYTGWSDRRGINREQDLIQSNEARSERRKVLHESEIQRRQLEKSMQPMQWRISHKPLKYVYPLLEALQLSSNCEGTQSSRPSSAVSVILEPIPLIDVSKYYGI